MDARARYVSSIHAVRERLGPTGVMDIMARSDRRSLRYLRSLFAIYDAADLAALDLPWWSYRAIDQVEAFLAARPDARVFEFGSGASTTWLARRAGDVHSLEHDVGFLRTVDALVQGHPNVTLHAVPAVGVDEHRNDVIRSDRRGHGGLDFTEYVRTIDAVGGEFDLIVVDGRARVACLRQALPHLSPGGIVVFDDADRKRYAPALTLRGTQAIVLRGLTPCIPFPTSTALIRRAA